VDYLQRVLLGHRIFVQELDNLWIVPFVDSPGNEKFNLSLEVQRSILQYQKVPSLVRRTYIRRRTSFRIYFASTELKINIRMRVLS
jgi:hypothetical protein